MNAVPLLEALEARAWHVWRHHPPPPVGASRGDVAVLAGIEPEIPASALRQLGMGYWPHLSPPRVSGFWVLQRRDGLVIAQGPCGILESVPGAAASISEKINRRALEELDIMGMQGRRGGGGIHRGRGGSGERYGGLIRLHLGDPSAALISRLRSAGYRRWDGAWQAVDCPGTIPLWEELVGQYQEDDDKGR